MRPLAADAAAQGFSAYQNRTMLCNALISALEHAPTLAAPLHAQLLSYLVLLHADEPQTILPDVAGAPTAVLQDASVKRALAFVACLARDDAVGCWRTLRGCELLEVACVLRLLPELRAAVLQQCNTAYNAQGAMPLRALSNRLWIASEADAARCAAAHGLPADDGAVRFRSATFVRRLKAPLEPPVGPPTLPAVQRWLQRKSSTKPSVPPSAAARAEGAVPARVALSEEERQSRKTRRRPPPKSLLADGNDETGGAAGGEAGGVESIRSPKTPPVAAAVPTQTVVALTLEEYTWRLLREGESTLEGAQYNTPPPLELA